MKFASIAALAASLAVADSQYLNLESKSAFLNLENKYYGNSTDTDTGDKQPSPLAKLATPFMAKYVAETLAIFMGELIYLNRLDTI